MHSDAVALASMAERARPHARTDYPHQLPIQTRWLDNDAYGHVNNVVYYSYFDTVVNAYLVLAGVLDIARSGTIGLVVDTQCSYFAELSFPQTATAGLRVARIGRSSVRYEIALFRGDDAAACAQGHLVHVYVDRATRRPVPLAVELRTALERIHR